MSYSNRCRSLPERDDDIVVSGQECRTTRVRPLVPSEASPLACDCRCLMKQYNVTTDAVQQLMRALPWNDQYRRQHHCAKDSTGVSPEFANFYSSQILILRCGTSHSLGVHSLIINRPLFYQDRQHNDGRSRVQILRALSGLYRRLHGDA